MEKILLKEQANGRKEEEEGVPEHNPCHIVQTQFLPVQLVQEFTREDVGNRS